MSRPPRPIGAPVLSRNNWIRLCVQGAVMTIGSLVAYQIGEDHGGAVVAATMLLTTLSVFHLFGALLSRDQLNTIFDRDTFPGLMQLRRYGISVLAIVAITALDFLERIFDTTGLSFNQWCICIGIATSIVVVEELIKFFLRRKAAGDRGAARAPHPRHPRHRLTVASTREHPCLSTFVTAASSRSSTSAPASCGSC